MIHCPSWTPPASAWLTIWLPPVSHWLAVQYTAGASTCRKLAGTIPNTTMNSVAFSPEARPRAAMCKAKKGRFQTNNNVVFVNRPLIPVKGVSNNLYLQRKMI